MVVVFSVNGALASYSLSYTDATHVKASLQNTGEKRRDIPETLELEWINDQWIANSDSEAVNRSIIQALAHNHPDKTVFSEV